MEKGSLALTPWLKSKLKHLFFLSRNLQGDAGKRGNLAMFEVYPLIVFSAGTNPHRHQPEDCWF
jgi:hypothetical protein